MDTVSTDVIDYYNPYHVSEYIATFGSQQEKVRMASSPTPCVLITSMHPLD